MIHLVAPISPHIAALDVAALAFALPLQAAESGASRELEAKYDMTSVSSPRGDQSRTFSPPTPEASRC
jgi:hypothetical protein